MAESIIIFGPTASGKSALGIHLAKAMHGEVINADARQVYAGMQVGTGAVTKEEMQGIPHHLLGTRPPENPYNAGVFLEDAKRIEADLKGRGILPIYVGGTGLYVQSLVEGLSVQHPADLTLRTMLEKRLQTEGNHAMWIELQKRDPDAAEQIHENNSRYVLRALELSMQSQEKQEYEIDTQEPSSHYRVLGISWDPTRLRERITKRHGEIFSGTRFDEEVRALMDRSISEEVWKTIGYLQMRDHILGNITREEALEKTIFAAFAYAKRQRTWLRRMQQRMHIQIVEGEPLTDQTDVLALLDKRQSLT
ncbi:tRNA (adenosine(37)-N6)-dimethylallyltransferase MiaA [Candidatus Gracilibacteria bacterium CG17_big_fil_post_rev_8_21_14_2_50_48_13]|nr:MAG: tRNA (adenosine(37)-N6)-dimethylallyltransferase MiaA [Candidatus Gracilibacteria bacterium CG17_big_fil_post_rev_8_21_14_2_50_48_13]